MPTRFLAKGNIFCAEADESDGSFLHYSPLYSVITNIDREHLDHYKTFDAAVEAYAAFIEKTNPNGCLFCCGDDENLLRLCRSYKGRHVLLRLQSPEILDLQARLKTAKAHYGKRKSAMPEYHVWSRPECWRKRKMKWPWRMCRPLGQQYKI